MLGHALPRRDHASSCLRHNCPDQPGRRACLAQDPSTAAFWKSVQAACDNTAAKPAGELGKRIAQAAMNEVTRFGGRRIDANGRIFRFGQTEAEHGPDDGNEKQTNVGQLGWWQVMKYWRSLFGDTAPDKIEVLGYKDGSTATDDAQAAERLRGSAGQLMRLSESVSDPAEREMLREAALRAAVVDTGWSAAFISYVVKQGGVAPNAFAFSNAHRAYIYDGFAVSAAEQAGRTSERIYRACPCSA